VRPAVPDTNGVRRFLRFGRIKGDGGAEEALAHGQAAG
jgi:hypothetical protein